MSEQVAFDFVSAPAYRQVGRRQFVLRKVFEHRERFRADFPGWLEKNMHLWEAFERAADAVWRAGRRHYSSRTLWEVMRHETTLRSTDDQFKVNNNFAPDVARLYLTLKPEREGFFETRGRA